jgi:hypothetical protein
MLEWLKQRIISWFLSRHVGRWIAVDRQDLHGETHSDVWCEPPVFAAMTCGARSPLTRQRLTRLVSLPPSHMHMLMRLHEQEARGGEPGHQDGLSGRL